MKEYKLIKKYPSLPKDWEVGMIVGLGDRPALYSPCHGKYTIKYLSDQEVENQEEYWRKQFKDPAFTTEDGLVVFESTKTALRFNHFPYVDVKTFDLAECALNSPVALDYAAGRGEYKIFFSKEKAEEYIRLNKPIYSYNDFKAAAKEFYKFTTGKEKFVIALLSNLKQKCITKQ